MLCYESAHVDQQQKNFCPGRVYPEDNNNVTHAYAIIIWKERPEQQKTTVSLKIDRDAGNFRGKLKDNTAGPYLGGPCAYTHF